MVSKALDSMAPDFKKVMVSRVKIYPLPRVVNRTTRDFRKTIIELIYTTGPNLDGNYKLRYCKHCDGPISGHIESKCMETCMIIS